MHPCLHRRQQCLQPFNQCRSKAAPRRLSRCSALISKAAKQQVVQGSTYEEIIEQLAHHALDAAQAQQDNGVYLVGIAGSPGSGKSTLAQQVAQSITQLCQQRGLGRSAAVAPMDGFHLYKKQLDAMPDPQEAYARRGAHWTFDSAAFVAAIQRLKQHGAASLPSFDHGVGDPIEDDIQIDAAQHAVVLVEGNYLFLELEPWMQLRKLFDDAWFVDCPVDLAMQRVFERQVAIGLAPEVSLERIEGNDRPNALQVNASKGAARLLVPSTVPFAGDTAAAQTRVVGVAAAGATVGTEAAAERSSSIS
eukprot:GHRQ01023534.1.p1 GENE.GHRQ01023534.1~~GHRQ01023534.1.p1  ORF type:complete len:306 (+),score=75.56 GHRQ01023534.1:124-1041(+)